MLSQKGQEAAPFELLVAVIIMGFVLLAGVNVMNVLKEEQCKGQLDNQMEKIKSAIENVAAGEGQRDFSFALPECFERGDNELGDPVSKLKVSTKTSRQICAAFCPGARIECKLLWFSTTDHHNVKCLRISTATNFDPANCDVYPGEFEAKNIEEQPMEDGQYVLVRKFDLDSQTADICAYKKKLVS